MRQLFLLLALICSEQSFAQRCAIACAKMNVLYIGVPNPVNIAVEGRWCKDLEVSVSNGKITPDEQACSFIVAPEKQGKVEITIRERGKTGKVLGRAEFRVKLIPDPIALVGGKNGGELRKEALIAQLGIITRLTGFDFDARFTVLGYTVTTYRGREVLFSQPVSGPMFTPEVIAAFNALKTYDKVAFTEMSYRAPDGRKGQLMPIEFRIVD